jgi:hypothetical protein
MLRRVAPVRKQLAERGFERLGGEALSLQLTGHLGRPSERRHEPPRPLRLALEPTERGRRGLLVDAVGLEVDADRLVPISPPGERRCTRRGVPAVVDVADALEGLERVDPSVGIDAGAFQPLVDLPPRPVAMPERLRGDVERVGVCVRPRQSLPLGREPA